MGAVHVVGLDVDEDALLVAETNKAKFDGDVCIDLIQCDVHDLGPRALSCIDTVIMNPPFGTRSKHADTDFLIAGCTIARSSVYSLHKRSTREYLAKWANKEARVKKAEVLAELRYDIPAMYKFHRKMTKDIDVDLWRFEMAQTR